MSNRSRRTVVAEAEPTFVQSCSTKWSKGLQRGARWDKDTFEDFPVCVHWFRQFMAAVAGICVGVAGVTGWFGLVGGFAFVTGATYLYYARFVEADELSYGDQGLKWEGLLPSLTVFLLMWILSFNGMDHVLLNVA